MFFTFDKLKKTVKLFDIREKILINKRVTFKGAEI